jgi:hypothetical protein
MVKAQCFAEIRREFYNKDGSHDGGETEWVYENQPLGPRLRECETLAQALAVLGPQHLGEYGRVEITHVKTYRGMLS